MIAYLSTDDLTGFHTYEELTFAPLAARGVAVDTVSWRAQGVDWSRYDLVVIRTPWDYQKDPPAFLRVLEEIAAATRLENSLSLCRWNLHKTYLRDLERAGIAIVPTVWGDGLPPPAALFEELAAEEIVIKPVVGANADHAHRLRRADLEAREEELARTFASRGWLAQPFMPAVVGEGEHSLFYFGGGYSHAVLKTPRPGDFRVQEEHGGSIRAVAPEPRLRAAGDAVMEALPAPALYARPDLVRDGDTWRVMEVELVEPSLYFPYDAGAPARFADAIVRRLAE